MKQRRRIYYSAAQRSEIWDRWQAGEPMSSIGRRFDRESSSVFSVISPTGGLRPADRHRAKQALSLSEREEVSRWLSMRCSLRSMARHLGRSPSTISREVQRNGHTGRSPISSFSMLGSGFSPHRTLRDLALPLRKGSSWLAR
jgi:DNA-binding CsgD family transcriptional regulator